MIRILKAIDAHVGGQPLRLLTEGVPRPSGSTLAKKSAWLRRNADLFRRAVVLEPRGHVDMTAALLVEPASPGAHAGIIFMDAESYAPMSGHGIIAAATIAVERDLFFSRETGTAEARIVFDTTAGTVHARARLQAHGDSTRVDSVAFSGVPSFVHTAAHAVRIGIREVRVDIAYGGVFHAIVDTEAIGIPLEPARLPDLRRMGMEIRESINGSYPVEHPNDGIPAGVAAVTFTGPPMDVEAHLRNVTVGPGGAVDRSPSGTGTSAVMAVLDAMGLLPDDQPFVHESLTGALFRGRAARRTLVGDVPALVAEVEGAAWVTGEHTFLIDEDDPMREGFRI